MRVILDGDVIVYEAGFGAETWAKAEARAQGVDGPVLPSWDMVDALLTGKIMEIMLATEADDLTIYITEGKTFREDIAKTRPYKGTRKDNKPWHYQNIRDHMKHVLGAKSLVNLEADDAMALDHLNSSDETIIASRDKDLRQIPGHFYSWELGKQPSFGPVNIEDEGWLALGDKKLHGAGYAFFCAQVLMGDITDNIPGLPGWGPVKTYEFLWPHLGTPWDLAQCLEDAYRDEDYLLEQGRLCWIVRRLNSDGSPELWSIGQTE